MCDGWKEGTLAHIQSIYRRLIIITKLSSSIGSDDGTVPNDHRANLVGAASSCIVAICIIPLFVGARGVCMFWSRSHGVQT